MTDTTERKEVTLRVSVTEAIIIMNALAAEAKLRREAAQETHNPTLRLVYSKDSAMLTALCDDIKDVFASGR